ncbi:hypothetical protein NIES2135_07550 [Leptolyngbya boryana NIES-2135]|jgi:hypothetical protein|uniref:DUF7910 domain-containing protein n=1 Tax=Leptolyngbya boryana NIES-2135 TaxID=1973484 RepID=A0A1Z4JB16_LEPBY|nr:MULTISPECIES: hypothetical protein [Leptolyngbya]BAY53942.1 hypothetical protein NIES2135_07550 [Leptolyngbya boryana NIES-2135]MBD2371559.1 hypothetical protein [Leptolyngbya sp. FACHB-161]MBD2378104.1 hypothetical protein [Leptolyngbya sp. FACHB-238]MBD2402509.1 hypothetical protein [Leptolyngbya sp. FACHB-239]MBD2409003.1 hypothetical protein [Leptolyngbya sp. FACHB-402]
MTGLVDGSTIVLKRTESNIGFVWLNGRLDKRLLGFVPTTSDSKTCYWKVHQVDVEVYQFENLGASGNGQEFWLDAQFDTATIRLASTQGTSTSGTHWRVRQGTDGSFTFEAIGSSNTSRKFWLSVSNSSAELEPMPSIMLASQPMSWRVLRVPEPGIPLRSGEVELRTARGEVRLLTSDIASLAPLSVTSAFTQLRVGPETGVTLFSEGNFQGTSQPVLGAIADLKSTRLTSVPRSLKVWSTTGKPYTGKWAIKAPNGQYLSQAQSGVITTLPNPGTTELFAIQPLAPAANDQQQVKIMGEREAFASDLAASQGQPLTLVEEDLPNRRKFSLKVGSNRWISFQSIKLSGNLVISLRALNGQSVYVEGEKLFVNPAAESVVFFQMIRLDGNKVAFKHPNGQYFCAEGGGGKEVVANRSQIGPWETFELVQLIDNQVAIKASTGHYVSVQWSGKNQVFANRSAIGPSETFEMLWSGAFGVTNQAKNRAIFTRAIKFAENESQVGEVLPGEVALYENVSYWGKAWIFQSDVARFTDINGLNDQVSSIILGNQTGATIYKDTRYGLSTTTANSVEDWLTTAQNSQGILSLGDLTDKISVLQANLAEDVVEDTPSLLGSQIGNDAMSSLRIWRNLPPTQVGIDFTCCLSQDYKLNSDQTLQEFSSYRTILQFPIEVTSVDVWATDTTSIMVEDQVYVVNEERSVRLSPNQMQRLMITSKAEGINTPGLKIRTNTMQSFERIVIFPDKYAHGKLAEIPANGLWEAKDNAGNLLVDRSKFNQSQIAAVQTSIQNTLATVEYVSNSSDKYAVDRTVNPKKILNPWKLNLMRSGGIGTNRSNTTLPATTTLSQADFENLLTTATAQGGTLAQGIFSSVGNALSSAVSTASSVVVGVAKDVADTVTDVANDVIHVITETAGQVTTWVIDTAEKVGAFAEGLIQRIGVALEKFIEYLRFLFAWNDILETQRYLAEAIEVTLRSDRLTQMIADPLRDLVGNQRKTLKGDMEQQRRKSAQSSTSIKGDNKQPEALEWLFAKLTSITDGGAAGTDFPSDAKTDPAIAQVGNSFFQEFEQIQTTFLAGVESLGDAIAKLIANPSQPHKLLSALFALVSQVMDDFLDLLQSLLNDLIVVIPSILSQLLQFMQVEVNIPFVKALFRQISGGQPLTMLNLATLLLAIPVTVTSKLIWGRTPFHNEPKLALALDESANWSLTALIVDSVRGLCDVILDSQPERKEGQVTPKFMTLLEKFTVVLSLTSVVASIFIADTLNKKEGELSDADRWSIYLYIFRGSMLCLELFSLVCIHKYLKMTHKDKTQPIPFERLRRMNAGTMVLSSILGAIDMALSSVYVERSQASPAKDAANVTTTIPQTLSFLRLPILSDKAPQLPLVLAALDGVCYGYALVVGIVDLADG